ncbi:MAG: YegS/Rv2252/BmrU family lipid kinase [Lachnospiraceae bacterium]|nr:YegS/Rv2252/BmrU family lipid kinase [Lachnospiraceae bacterium]
MQHKKLYFVYNPFAGKERIRSNLLDIIGILSKAGYEVTVHPTMKRGDAVKAVSGIQDDYEMIVCSGGDGTLNETVTGLMKGQKQIPLGYIPAGTTNDFARSLGIPSRMMAAADAIVSGRSFRCDIGTFNDRYFVYVAAFGLFTDVSYDTDQTLKNTLGHSAYILEGAKRLGEIKSVHVRAAFNGIKLEDDFMFGMVTNSRSVGGFKGLTGPDVDLNDGEFEVLLVRTTKTPAEFQEVLRAFFLGKGDAKYVYTFKTSCMTIDTDEDVSWTLDGEFGGSVRQAKITNLKSAVEMKVP